MRLLLVDDDDGIRALLRATFEAVDLELDEAADARAALKKVAARRPDVIVLDVGMPGMSGIELCERLKSDPATADIPIAVLTGTHAQNGDSAAAAGADAFVLKPFSPLELLGVVERLAGGLHPAPFRGGGKKDPEEQLLLYARDLRYLLELERAERRALESAYQQTVGALASALETKDTGTRQHSQRVQRYAVELARAVDRDLAESQSAQYGFLLHDVGKIGIPDDVLQKPGALDDAERRLMRTHTLLGEQMLSGVTFLKDAGLQIVRSHHERWDGAGYPDGIAGSDIPLGARIFAVADTVDAITSDRPYRRAGSWETALAEIRAESGRQFDPAVVEAFGDCEPRLRAVHEELIAA